MAIAAADMSNNSSDDTNNNNNNNKEGSGDQVVDDDDHHEQDMVMPGFRFHPTEEELVEFYLRRKVEGKRFNVELITFLDLYRYDPWELPALAAIGEREWFFYVPRDRKYRNGDRPNRVTTSGYWKATGADRMIRTETSRPIGLKKTLVFYSGKAPKGIRTSWIMNEYRLPHHDTEKYQKTEISLCRVYKRAGVEDHPSLPRCLTTRASSSRSSTTSQLDKKYSNNSSQQDTKFQSFAGQSNKTNTNTDANQPGDNVVVTTALNLSKHNIYRPVVGPISTSLGLPSSVAADHQHHHHNEEAAAMFLNQSNTVVDDLHRLVNYQQSAAAASMNQFYDAHHQHQQQQQQPQQNSPFPTLMPQTQALPITMLQGSLAPSTAFSDRLWEWNPIPEANRDYNNPFK